MRIQKKLPHWLAFGLSFSAMVYTPGVLALGITLTASLGTAAVVAQDDFESYAAGAQIGDGSGEGGTGWGGIWGTVAGGRSRNDMYIRDGAAYETVSQVMMIAENSDTSTWLSRKLPKKLGSLGSKTVYIAFTARNTNGGNREAGLRLMKDGDTQLILGQTAGQNSWRLWDVNEGAQNSNLPTTIESLIVLKIELSGNDGGDTVTFWVNPDPTRPEDPAGAEKGRSFTSTKDLDSVNALRFGTNGGTENGAIARFFMDHVAVSTTWEDAMPQNLSPVLLKKLTARLTVPDEQVEHGIIFSDSRLFAGWPANYGMWQWGNEILISFALSPYVNRNDFHNINDKAYQSETFARSLDGGKTWAIEEHPSVGIPGKFNDDGLYVKDLAYPEIPAAIASPGNINFLHPDFVLRSWRNKFYISYDRGHNWQGPYRLPDFGFKILMARSNYLITSNGTCRLFYSVTNVDKEIDEHARLMMVETKDGGKTFEQVAWVTEDPLEGRDLSYLPAYAIMPGLQELDDGTILAAIRWRIKRDWWIDIRGSTNQGRSWSKWSDLKVSASCPANLVRLEGENMAIIYGWRSRPYGLRARLSKDNGKTWSDEYVLRADGREWDLGYSQAKRLPDGRILIVYYYTTPEIQPEHIAYTIWNPPVD
ncbi:MAG: exo-alpha-sialidase [Kiritimatiellales bacterium]